MPPKVNLLGQRFGRLTVIIEEEERAKSGSIRWRCRCDCGGETVATGDSLRRGQVVSCGCFMRERASETAKQKLHIDLIGERFGKLTVIAEASRRGNKGYARYWLCKCDCGNEKEVAQNRLRSGRRVSCGECYSAAKTHGMCGIKMYWSWQCMLQRCENPNNPYYHNYGARGIKVYPEWHDFQVFHDWSMSHGWRKGLQIDRIDVNGNYEPDNCRWVTHAEQQRNRRDNHIVSWNDRDWIFADLQRETGIPYSTLYYQLFKKRYSVDKALAVWREKNVS